MQSKSSLPVSIRPVRLATYLTGAVGSSFLIGAPQAEAAVTSITFGFGSVLNLNSNLAGVDTPTTPSFGSMYVYANIYNDGSTTFPFLFLGDDSTKGKGSFYFQNLLEPDSFYGSAKFLADGTIVGNQENGQLGQASFVSPDPNFQINTNQTNKNIGFLTSAGNWGWANVSWNAATKQLTFHSAHVESVAGNPIMIPEPSRALLALAGLGVAGLRRRRKQTA
jgi:MYXO-CTERM domain-containing protein